MFTPWYKSVSLDSSQQQQQQRQLQQESEKKKIPKVPEVSNKKEESKGGWLTSHLHTIEASGSGSDPILETMGDVGIWQVTVVIIMALFNMPAALQFISPEVAAMEVGYWCRRPVLMKNLSVAEWIKLSGTQRRAKLGGTEYNPCRIKKLNYSLSYNELKDQADTEEEINCKDWEYSTEWWTIIAEFNLACSSVPINTIAEISFSGGTAVGSILVGYLADSFGRRGTLLTAQFVNILAGIVCAMIPSYNGYIVWRVVQGLVCEALMTSTSVLCVEVTGGRWKSRMSSFYMYSYGMGYFSLAALAHIFTKWSHLELIIALLSTMLFSFWWVIPESPRWLLVKKRLDGVMLVLETAASMNSKPLPSNVVIQLKKMEVLNGKSNNKVKMKMLFKTPIMKRLTIVTPFIFLFIYIPYFGQTLRTVNTFSITDPLTNLMIKGGLEMLATTVALTLPYTTGICNLAIMTMTEGVLCLMSAIWPSKSSPSMIIFTVSKFFASVTNTMLTTTIASYYPTVIRTTGVGWGYTCVGFALLIATNIIDFGIYSESMPQVIFGVSACAGAISLLFLPKELYVGSYDLIHQMENTYLLDLHEDGVHTTDGKRRMVKRKKYFRNWKKKFGSRKGTSRNEIIEKRQKELFEMLNFAADY